MNNKYKDIKSQKKYVKHFYIYIYIISIDRII